MNKNILPLAAVLLLAISWAGCNKSGKLNETSKFQTPSGPVALKLKWTKGERVVQDMVMTMGNDITIPGQPNPMKQEIRMGEEFGMTVLNESTDGGHEVELDFLSFQMSGTLAGKTNINYDSTRKETANKSDPVGDTLGKVVGAKIRYFMDASNAVTRIEGTEELASRLSSISPSDSLGTLKSMFSEDYLKQMMSHNQFMPNKPVQPGDSWPLHIQMPMAPLGKLTVDYTITLQGWEPHGPRNCARLEFQGTIKSEPDPTPPAGGVKIGAFEGDVSGVSWFDPELGIIIDTTVKEDIQMAMSVTVAGKTQNMSNDMHQAISMKLASLK